MLINFTQVGFGYDDKKIFDGVDLTINEGERIGLIGLNGEGKTTLIKLIMGELVADCGDVFKKSGIKIGYLEQNGGFDSEKTVYEEMLAIFESSLRAVESLRIVEEQISHAEYGSNEYKRLEAKYESLNKFIQAHDSYNVDVRIKQVLGGMGFADMFSQVINTMSGGEKTRLKLCKLLLEEPELLVLDEPTNHLDLKTLFWLEDYLQSYKGAIFTVSHDRYFLDRLVTKVYELEYGKIESYKGNYTKYKALKAERVLTRQREYEKQQVEIAHMQDYVARNLVRASTTKMAQSRQKKLEAMDIVEKPKTEKQPPVFKFEYDEKPYENVLNMQSFSLKAGDKTLIENSSLRIVRGSKTAIVGANGTGKTTLIKSIVQGSRENIISSGEVSIGRFVKIGYYDQENAGLDENNSVLSEFWGKNPLLTQTEARSALARARLGEEDMEKTVGSLSGGERAKLALCLLEEERANFLILDEPTNHLDLAARESLEEALKSFDGTLLFVSHDRYFIQSIADSIAEIDEKKIKYYPSDYAQYVKTKEKNAEDAARESEQAKAAIKREAEKSEYKSKEERAKLARNKQKLAQIEKEIASLEEKESELLSEMSSPEVSADYKKMAEKCRLLDEVRAKIEELYLECEKYL